MQSIAKYVKQVGLIVLSVFIPFVILAKLENTYIPYRQNIVGSISELTLYDIKILFGYNMPMFYVIGFIVQAMFIMPLWNRARTNKVQRAIAISNVLAISIIIAFSLSLFLCKLSDNFSHLLSSAAILTAIQLMYWGLNAVTLYFITCVQNRSLRNYKLNLTQ